MLCGEKKMIKITDRWVVEKDTHKTYYYTYEEENKTICVSKCVRNDGRKTYCMSNDANPYQTYGSQEEIKKIVDEIESNELKNQIIYAIYHNSQYYWDEYRQSLKVAPADKYPTNYYIMCAVELDKLYELVKDLKTKDEIVVAINKRIAYYHEQAKKSSSEETKRYWKRHNRPLEEILGYIKRVEKE